MKAITTITQCAASVNAPGSPSYTILHHAAHGTCCACRVANGITSSTKRSYTSVSGHSLPAAASRNKAVKEHAAAAPKAASKGTASFLPPQLSGRSVASSRHDDPLISLSAITPLDLQWPPDMTHRHACGSVASLTYNERISHVASSLTYHLHFMLQHSIQQARHYSHILISCHLTSVMLRVCDAVDGAADGAAEAT